MPAMVPLRWFVVAVVVAAVFLAFALWKIAEERRLRERTAQDRRRAQALREEAERQLAGAAAEAQRRGNIAAQEQWQAALNKTAAERDRAVEALAAEREVFRLREEALIRALNAESAKSMALNVDGATIEIEQARTGLTGHTERTGPLAGPPGAG
jgi:hypothetical protein